MFIGVFLFVVFFFLIRTVHYLTCSSVLGQYCKIKNMYFNNYKHSSEAGLRHVSRTSDRLMFYRSKNIFDVQFCPMVPTSCPLSSTPCLLYWVRQFPRSLAVIIETFYAN